nr:hypothetical protein [Actinomycetota bacterium]
GIAAPGEAEAEGVGASAPAPPGRAEVRPSTAATTSHVTASESTQSGDAASEEPGLSPSEAFTGSDYRFTPSPSYEEDRTVFALGTASQKTAGTSLLKSEDGGATWRPLAAHGLAVGSGTVLLPPAYPDDRTIFVRNRGHVLFASNDDGASFEPVAPATAGATLSPLFSDGDRRVFIGGAFGSAGATVYRPDTKAVEPLVLPLPAGTVPLDFGFSPAYASDGAFLVRVVDRSRARGDRVVTGALNASPHDIRPGEATASGGLFRCTDEGCDEVLRDTEIMGMRWSPDGSSAFAWTRTTLFRSSDRGRTFQGVSAPGAERNDWITQVTTTNEGLLYATTYATGFGGDRMFVSRDGGETWHRLSDVAGPRINDLLALPDGKLLTSFFVVSGPKFACSADGGATWHSECADAA